MNTNLEKLTEQIADSGIEIKYHEPMSRHTTFRIGGYAALYLIPHNGDELSEAIAAVRENGCKSFILGNGSNVVFPDAGYAGAVISTEALDKIEVDGERIICGAGVSLTQAAKAARDHGLTGMEFVTVSPEAAAGRYL